MKGSFLYALVPGLSVALLSACFDAKFDQHLDALSDSEAAAAGVQADTEASLQSTAACEDNDRLGSSCSATEGICARQGIYVCEQDEVVCNATITAAEGRTEPCEAGPDEQCDGAADKAAEAACCTDADCGSAGPCVPADENRATEDGSQSWGVCMGTLDADTSDDATVAEQSADSDAGVQDSPAEEDEAAPAWQPTLCEASTEDCRCFRDVCLPGTCADHDPTLFASGVLINEETPQLGVPICYHACEEVADCPAELPVCVADTHIWADEAERAQGCFAR